MDKKPINKDLILREKLAIERTQMANDRTFLSFIRTGLYFSIAGLSINELLHLSYGYLLEIVFFILAAIIIITGIFKYISLRKKINQSKKHVGNYKLEWEDDLV
jgi:putative membrane protein